MFLLFAAVMSVVLKLAVHLCGRHFNVRISLFSWNTQYFVVDVIIFKTFLQFLCIA